MMRESVKFISAGVATFLVFMLLVGLGMEIRGDAIAGDCRDFGKFRLGDELYRCEPEE